MWTASKVMKRGFKIRPFFAISEYSACRSLDRLGRITVLLAQSIVFQLLSNEMRGKWTLPTSKSMALSDITLIAF